MKLNIELPALKSMLAKLTGIVEKKHTIPALANVALTAADDVLTGKTTDLDIEVTARTAATVMQGGEITVPAQMLAAIVGKLPAGALVSLEVKDHKLIVKAGRSKYQLETLPIEDFPQIASVNYSHQFKAQAPDLARLFNLSKFAMSTEETRYYLNGVYLHPSDDNDVLAVSTDGHRFAKITMPSHANFPGVIVPRKTVMELIKSLDIGEVNVSVSDTKIKFDMGATVIVSKIVDGRFPDYARIIPVGNDNVMTADAATMKAASDRAATVSDDRSRAVRIALTSGTATLSTSGALGDATEEVEVAYNGNPMTVGFNSKYLAEVLANCSGSDVRFELGSEMSPAIIKPSDDPNALYIVMPMRA